MMLSPSGNPDAEFNRMMWRVLAVSLPSFGAATLLLIFFVKGFKASDQNEKRKMPLGARMVILCAALLLIGIAFIMISRD